MGVSLQPSGIQTLVTQGDAEGLADRGADAPARDPVIDPEPADGLIGVGQGEAVGRQGVGEIGRD